MCQTHVHITMGWKGCACPLHWFFSFNFTNSKWGMPLNVSYVYTILWKKKKFSPFEPSRGTPKIKKKRNAGIISAENTWTQNFHSRMYTEMRERPPYTDIHENVPLESHSSHLLDVLPRLQVSFPCTVDVRTCTLMHLYHFYIQTGKWLLITHSPPGLERLQYALPRRT